MQINPSERIKERLTMRDVLERYGIEHHRRMRCPIHGGKDLSFQVFDKSFTCFSHCGSGDLIDFVCKYFNLSFKDAVKKLDNDFMLGLFNEPTEADKRRWEEAQKNKALADLEKTIDTERYYNLLSERIRLERNKAKHKPQTPNEEIHPLFEEALLRLPQIDEELDRMEVKRCHTNK